MTLFFKGGLGPHKSFSPHPSQSDDGDTPIKSMMIDSACSGNFWGLRSSSSSVVWTNTRQAFNPPVLVQPLKPTCPRLLSPVALTNTIYHYGSSSPQLKGRLSLSPEEQRRHVALSLHQHRRAQCLARRWFHVEPAGHCSQVPRYGPCYESSGREARHCWHERCPRLACLPLQIRKSQHAHLEHAEGPGC